MFTNKGIVTFYSLAFLYGSLLTFISGCTEFSINTITYPGFNGFDANDERWYVSEGGIGSYSIMGGNPDGYVIGTDNSSGIWYFIASNGFVGEARRSYGRTLCFDLKQSATDFQSDTNDDIILTNGITTLTFDTAYNPKTTWTHYSVKLDDTNGWKKGSSNATKEDMQTVLQNLTDLRIRGEFRAGPDRGGLDNVTLY
ncbi:hypothetical protein GCM10028819_36940 [Spirosoma humi]